MQNRFQNIIPPATKWILLANVAMFLLDMLLSSPSFNLSQVLGLYYVYSGNFYIWQPITYMFMHADFSHIFFNMFAVWMFGRVLEEYWGSRRYLVYYFVTGIGAGIVQEIIQYIQFGSSPYPVGTVGASGAVFGLLLAYACLFPQARIFIFPIPIPIRAWIMVAIYAFIEFFAGISGGDNVAHFAHLGGMLFGLIFIFVWKKKMKTYGYQSYEEESKLKQWWNSCKFKYKKRKQKKEENHRFQHFHYAEPIREEKTQPEPPQRDLAREAEINRILDKVKYSGYDALTEDEKRTLFSK